MPEVELQASSGNVIAQAVPRVEEKKSLLPHITTITATLVTVTYATGFFIVSIYLGRFGIFFFNPLKPKVFVAGALFLLLTVVPALAVLKFPLLGMTGTQWKGTREIKFKGRYKLSYFIGFYVPSCGLAYFIGPFFSMPQIVDFGFGLGWISVLIYGALSFLENYYHDRFWYLFLVGYTANSVFLVYALLHAKNQVLFDITNWFFLVSVVASWGHYYWKEKMWKTDVMLERAPFYLIGLIVFYGTHVYRHLMPQYGGGNPVPVTMYFSTPVPVVNGPSAKMFLIEETDQGFYLLVHRDDKTSYFVKRDFVSSIRYGDQ